MCQYHVIATGAGKSLAMCFGAIVALSKNIEGAQVCQGRH